MATLLRKAAGLALGLSLVVASSAAYAQATHEAATILRTNTDLKNNKVFAEIAFEGQGCAKYHLKFKLKKNGTDLGYQQITVLNNPVKRASGAIGKWVFKQNGDGTTSTTWTAGGSTYVAELTTNDSVMTNLTIAGYSLEFSLTPAAPMSATDSVEVCMESIEFASECKGCGVGNTDMVFTKNDVAATCPYKGADVLACYERDSRAKNWEAWIRDSRDCQAYRIVQMPDGRWWFAQNLNYWESGASTTKPVKQGNAGPATTGSDILARSWCPGGATSTTGTTTVNGDGNSQDDACKTYGALYTWATVMSLDGYAASTSDASLQHSMATGVTSARRGICPEGWYVPTRYDWGKMLNIIEAGCSNDPYCPSSTNGENATSGNRKASACFHNYKDVTTNSWAASKCAFKDLLSTDVAPARTLDGAAVNFNGSLPVVDTLVKPVIKLDQPATIFTYADKDNPSWNYFKAETAGTDRYGFSIKPTGVRNSAGDLFYYRGEFAGFWTSQHASTTLTPTYATTSNAFMVGFRYNYRLNSDFNSAIQSAAWNKNFGLAVRCIAKVQL